MNTPESKISQEHIQVITDNARVLHQLIENNAVTKELSKEMLQMRLELFKRAPHITKEDAFKDVSDDSKEQFKEMFMGVPAPSQAARYRFFEAGVSVPSDYQKEGSPCGDDEILQFEMEPDFKL